MNQTKENRKTSKGITLVSLVITIIVMLIVTSISIYTAQNRFSVNNLSKMYNDIDLLSDKVSNYYLKYSALPVVRDGSNTETVYSYTNLNFNKNANDNDTYYILDLSALEEISLNYGKEGFQKPNESDDVYIINEASHIIYYVKGIENKGTVYHTVPENAGSINDTVPSSKPQINIVSGRLNSSGVYTSKVELEIVPGKDNWSGIESTTYTVDEGAETEITAENNRYTITTDGTHNITAKSKDAEGNISENTISLNVTIAKIVDKENNDAQDKVLSETENIEVWDDYGNKAVIPAGFKVTKDADYIPDGLVIEDVKAGNTGSQFVWVPVGTVYQNEAKTESETITLGRYSWDGSIGTVVQSATVGGGFEAEVAITDGSYNFTEQQKTESGKGTNGNALAKDIVAFCNSATTNGGYYIGRYEAGDSSAENARTGTSGTSTPGTLVCQKGKFVYNWILQKDASKACQDMYAGKPFTSDLVNSYAWDTAIAFIQQCGNEPNASTYSKENMGKTFLETGANGDQYRNINDMSGHVYEWTTETSSNGSNPCTSRGGLYGTSTGSTGNCTSERHYGRTAHTNTSFRPLLYL